MKKSSMPILIQIYHTILHSTIRVYYDSTFKFMIQFSLTSFSQRPRWNTRPRNLSPIFISHLNVNICMSQNDFIFLTTHLILDLKIQFLLTWFLTLIPSSLLQPLTQFLEERTPHRFSANMSCKNEKKFSIFLSKGDYKAIYLPLKNF